MGNGDQASMNMNPKMDMGHLIGSGSMSLAFAITLLTVCAILVFHIAFTVWKRHRDVYKEAGQHNILAHSLSMSLGMVSTMSICIIVGSIMNGHLSAAYILGFIVGLIVGLIISVPFRSLAILDGMVAGVMGGLMGVMLGTMMPKVAWYTLSIFLVVLFAFTWAVLFQRIFLYPKSSQRCKDKEGFVDVN